MNKGYRWLKVNTFLSMYSSTEILSNGLPKTEVLAYAQLVENGTYRALRSMVFTAVPMAIEDGPIDDIMIQIEQYIHNEESIQAIWNE